MSDLRGVLERARDDLRPEPNGLDRLHARRRRRERRQRTGTGIMALVVALGALAYLVNAFSQVTSRRVVGGFGDGEIVFTLFRHPASTGEGEPEFTIYAVAVDGGTPRAVTPGDADYLAPAWSPDGRTLAVVRFARTGEELDEAIYAIDVVSGEERRLLTTGQPKPVSVTEIAWSPDGSRIGFIYARYPDGPGPHSEADTELRLFVMNADGSDPEPLTPGDVNVSSFAWSPDGSQIAYTVETLEPGGVRFRSDIWVMELDSSESWPLTSDGRSNDPAWSPDGDEIAFVRHSADYEDSDIYLVSANGVAVWRLTDTPEAEESPAWSPDGSDVTFTRTGESFESCRLVVASAETGTERDVVSHDALGGCPQSPTWRPSSTPADQPSSDGIVWDETYALSNFRVEYPAEVRNAEGEQVVDDTQALVSFDSRWTGSVFPGEASCTIRIVDRSGEEIASQRFGYAISSSSREGNEFSIPVEEGIPATATGSCGPGTRPTGNYVFSDLRVELGSNAPRLVGQVSWGSLRPPLDAWCEARFRGADGSTSSYFFTLSVGEGELTVLLTDDLLGATVLSVDCQPYTGQETDPG